MTLPDISTHVYHEGEWFYVATKLLGKPWMETNVWRYEIDTNTKGAILFRGVGRGIDLHNRVVQSLYNTGRVENKKFEEKV